MKYLLWLYLALTSIATRGQKFHCFLFCKTADPEIGKSVIINYANMEIEAQMLAQALNMTYAEHAVIGNNFTIANVEDAIEKSNITPDDFVLLYFSTHGAKSTQDLTIFPQLDIPTVLVSSYKEHEEIAGKHPKVLITVVEACSGFLDITPQEAFIYEQGTGTSPQNQLSNTQITNVKQLFGLACELIVTAGQPGKNTWATSTGSMFTNCFLRALNQYINLPADQSHLVTWDNILQQAKQYTFDMTSTTPITYYPVWEKSDCTSKVALVGPMRDTSLVQSVRAELSIKTKHKFLRFKNPYDVSLRVVYTPRNNVTIDSVTYFLHKTMENPIVTVYNAEDDFFLSLAVWGTFPIKAKLFFSDKTQMDLYKNFNFSGRRKLD